MTTLESLPEDVIDIEVFGQLLEMDEEDEREFSQSLVWNYFEQAESTFASMDTALAEKNLQELSTLGHFLKGSSAAVGVIKVRDSCEAMQHYGKQFDADADSPIDEETALSKLTQRLSSVKEEYREAEKVLRTFFGA
ncbi:Phosphorelay intermediate protein [Malassezia cuniculi]|uniref:Phosphorelay intermediate protein n=1 Tax=Malassezia cuniculi TaxID=948313 RepID=A0AAF0EWT1_9BASI|nr:Phosphorelay intermediate protein [Malassezia cuniculi]